MGSSYSLQPCLSTQKLDYSRVEGAKKNKKIRKTAKPEELEKP
jgi:hypothetical protein